MATVIPTVEELDRNTFRFTWALLTTTNADGSPIPERFADYADRTVQILGTFGVAGNVNVQGSLDGGTTWAVLNDPFGVTLTNIAAAIRGITEIAQLTRPFVTAGDGTTNLTVVIICRRSRSSRGI